jgi:hypothetical protein
MSSEERIGVAPAPTTTTIPSELLQPALTPAVQGNVVPMQAQPPVVRAAFDYIPRSFDQALAIADKLANSELVPKDYRGKPDNVFVAMQWGHEIGLKPMQAVQNIAVINGRPSLWGDAMLALVRNSPLCEYVREEFTEDGTAVCRVKRRGDGEQIRTFSVADQEKAGLMGRDTHKSYPARMRAMRARAWALRDVFTDVLRGIPMAEEAMDMLPVVDSGPAAIPQAPRVPQPKAKPTPQEGDPIGAATRRAPPVAQGPDDDEAAKTLASEGMHKMIRKRLEAAALSTADLVKKFPDVPEDLAGISVKQANAILAWTANPGE